MTLTVLGTILYTGYTALRDKRKSDQEALKKASEASPKLLQFRAEDAGRFTHLESRGHFFDAFLARAIAQTLLLRSAVLVPPPPGVHTDVRVWSLVPLQEGAEIAAKIVQQAERRGQVVLGTLSLALLATGAAHPMLLVIGPPGLERYTQRRVPDEVAPFAVLSAPPAAVVTPRHPPPPVTPAPPPQATPLESTTSAPAPIQNGIATHAPTQSAPAIELQGA